MKPAAIEIVKSTPERCEVRGALTFATARRAREAGERCFAASSAPQIEVDCGDVTDADSAGLAVLLDWLAFADRNGRSLHFTRLPEKIQAVARISEVEELLKPLRSHVNEADVRP